jgi:hypothetical protein
VRAGKIEIQVIDDGESLHIDINVSEGLATVEVLGLLEIAKIQYLDSNNTAPRREG